MASLLPEPSPPRSPPRLSHITQSPAILSFAMANPHCPHDANAIDRRQTARSSTWISRHNAFCQAANSGCWLPDRIAFLCRSCIYANKWKQFLLLLPGVDGHVDIPFDDEWQVMRTLGERSKLLYIPQFQPYKELAAVYSKVFQSSTFIRLLSALYSPKQSIPRFPILRMPLNRVVGS